MPDDPDFLRQFLADRDMPCPSCGYNLRSLQSSRCPECGDELKLVVGMVEPRQAALLTGLVAIASGMGLSGLLLIYAAIQTIRDWRFPSFAIRFVLVNGAGLVVFGGLLVIWLSKWRQIRRASPGSRWLLAAGCWFAAVAWAVLFSFTIK
ncbi:MAG: hypothetical protein ABSH20_19290 [Tepidisphaeraceae bacterium]